MNSFIQKLVAKTIGVKYISLLILIYISIPCTSFASDCSMISVSRGPYLQNMTPTSVVVKWRTSSATQSKISYGTSISNLSNTLSDPVLKTNHELTIPGSPNGIYYYQIENSSDVLVEAASDLYFKLAPEIGTATPVRAWILGDSGTATFRARNVRNAYYNYIQNDHTDLMLFLGDNAYNSGTDAEYQNAMFQNMYEDKLKNTVSYSCLGNHDGYTASSSTQSGPYYDIFTLPTAGEAGGVASGTEAYYSFDYANIHFISLESYETDRSVNSAMYNWVENDIQSTTQDWIVAFWHHPPYTKGSHDSDNVNDSNGSMRDMRENFLPMLEDNGVDLVLSGHSHSYERSFFVNGHYGLSSTFNHNIHTIPIDGDGDGQEGGLTGAYAKGICTEGSVYITAGSSGKTSSGSLNHPVMNYSAENLGSVVLEASGQKIDVKFLRETGSIDDFFTIYKELPGYMCDDENPDTYLDVFDNACNCAGVLNPQCNDGDDFNIGEFTIVNDITSITPEETSGLTINDAGDFFLVDDYNGNVTRINGNGETTFNLGLNSCRDHESITFLESVSTAVQRFAIAEERSRTIRIYDLNQITLSSTLVGTFEITGISGQCVGNDGIEGIAYESGSNTIYFAEEGDRIIYQFTLPSTISSTMTVNPSQVVDLTTMSEFSSCTFSGMDILPNGNLILLMTHGGCSGDSGDYPRQLIEIDPCGNFVERFDLSIITDNNFETKELEGVVAINDHIYIVGEEYFKLYDLVRDAPTSITVDAPGLGDVFSPGDQFNIQWTSQNLTGNVRIDLYKGGNPIQNLSLSTSNNSPYLSSFNNSLIAGSNYQIKISSVNDPTIFDFSDQFTLVDPASITVLEPGNGDEFSDGDGIIIEWLSNNVNNGVKIELYKSSSLIQTITPSTTNLSSLSWVLNEDTPGTDYRIKISSFSDPTVFDFGDYFSIVSNSTSTITVTSPGINDVYSPGSNMNISWTYADINNLISLALYKNNALVANLGFADPTPLSSSLTIPISVSPGNDYHVKATDPNDPSVFDFGDFFTIQNTPMIIITNPVGGEVFTEGQTMIIDWNSVNVPGNVFIQLHKIGSTFESVIESNYAHNPNGSNTLNYTIPNVDAGQYEIFIYSIDDMSIWAQSGAFDIQDATIIVTNPSAGDIYNPGQNISVQWFSVGITTVDIYLFHDGQIVGPALATGIPSDGLESVTLANSLVDDTDYRIYITSTVPNNNAFSDFFTITNACPEDFIITNSSTANSNVEALNTITSNQALGSNSTGIYHAGDEVLLTDGFLVSDNSVFRAYIEGCTGTFQSIIEDTQSLKD